MTKIQAVRLLKLAQFLEERVKPVEFYIGDWVSKRDCGTVACAAGWAGLMPEFQKRGFITELGNDGYLDSLSYNGNANIHLAIKDFFGIDIEDEKCCFIPGGYDEQLAEIGQLDNCEAVTPKMAADKIRETVKEVYPNLKLREKA